MAKINLLDSSIYNRIAAGEVVENPKSVVKELVENSIDSGATSITVEITGGGIDYIRVSDNGAGMNAEDLQKSVLPHATSKISSLTDLDQIITLGFRGEALASIASVSDLKITSREQDAQLGSFIQYSFGTLCDSGECGAGEGTNVCVQNLFQKIPARRKFLRKPSTEAAEISNYIARAIISNYNVAIKFVSDGETIYHSDGNGLHPALYSIYGKEFLDNLVFFENAMSDISLYGFVGKPGFSKHNRSYQTLIVNGRYVINNDIIFVMQSCYKDYLMTRQFPVWILFVDIPADLVDVNVHPGKMDIKFADSAAVKKCIYSTVKEVINSINPQNTLFFTHNQPKDSLEEQESSFINKSQDLVNSNPQAVPKKQNYDSDQITETSININKLRMACDNLKNSAVREATTFSRFIDNSHFVDATQFQSANLDPKISNDAILTPNSDLISRNQHQDTHSNTFVTSQKNDAEKSDSITHNAHSYIPTETGRGTASNYSNFDTDSSRYTFKESSNSSNLDANFSNLGLAIDSNASSVCHNRGVDGAFQHEIELDQRLSVKVHCRLFGTYILLEYQGDAYLIDQHAAHERIIFDQLMKYFESGSPAIQPLLLPYIFDLPHSECHILQENSEILEKIGFALTKLSGNSFSISAVPHNCVNINCQEFINYFFENLNNNVLKESDLMRERAARAACKAAVKGRDDLSTDEILILLDKLQKTPKLFCPHGRPIVVKISKKEVEKWFKRIV